MTISVRAIYEKGYLRLLDKVDLKEGQFVLITIHPVREEQPSTEIISDNSTQDLETDSTQNEQ